AEGHTFTAFYTVGDQFYNSIKSNAKFDDFWPKSIQGYYRYDSYNPNKNQKDYLDTASGRIGEYDIHSLGLNLFFAQTTKFQLQLNHYIYDLETASQKDSNELQAQFQYTFYFYKLRNNLMKLFSKKIAATFLALSTLGLSLHVHAANPKEIRISVSGAGEGGKPRVGGSFVATAHARGVLEQEFKKDGIKVTWLFFPGAGPATNE